MTDRAREPGQGRAPVKESRQHQGADATPTEHTEGTNRDFDEKEESANQGHGHPREERGTHTTR